MLTSIDVTHITGEAVNSQALQLRNVLERMLRKARKIAQQIDPDVDETDDDYIRLALAGYVDEVAKGIITEHLD